MKKVLFVATTAKGHINVFHIPYIKKFKKDGFIVHTATNGDEEVPFADKNYKICIERNPFCVNNVKAYKQLCSIFKKENYDIIICHTPMGATLTRLAGKNTNAKKIIYMAHGFHFFENSSLKSKIIYKNMEKILSKYTDKIITINSEDFNAAKKFKLKENGNVYIVNGIGVDTAKIKNTNIDTTLKRKEFGISEDKCIVLTIGEFIKRKNYETTIKAFSNLKDDNYILIICGRGKLENDLKQMVKNLNVENKVIFAGFRKDINEIIKMSDIFIFPSFQEGLPVAVMEAMAGGLPVVCSNVRGNRDLIKNNDGGFVIECTDINGFTTALEKLKDKNLREKMGSINMENVKKYDIRNVIDVIYNIYIN